MPEKIYCLLCKETLVTNQEKELGTHFYCSAEFAKNNINNLFVPETTHKSVFALVSFNILVISLFSLIIFIFA